MKFIKCIKRATAAIAIVALSNGFPGGASAQTHPNKPIRIIDGFPPGGATTFIARVIGEHLTERTGQSVVVDNRPGAGSNLGAAIAAKAAPDGYTLFIALTLWRRRRASILIWPTPCSTNSPT